MIFTEKKQDLTEGSIYKKLLLFFLPIFVGSLFQQLYTTVDAIILGQFAGKEALASIDAVLSLTKLPVNFFVGLSTGATIITSQYFGAKKEKALNEAVHTAIAFAFTGGLILSVLGVVLAPYGLQLMKVPDDIYNYTLSYTRIYFSGLTVSMVYNIGAGIMRAVGNAKTPLFILLVANIANVLLDLIFVGLFKWHVVGAALTTVFAQFISVVLVIVALTRTKECYKLSTRNIRFHKPILRNIVTLGLPIGFQSTLYPIANMMIQSNINQFGTNIIAAWAICFKLDFLIWLITDALAITASTFVAQNYGAGRFARIKTGVNICIGLCVLIITAISFVLYFWCEPLGRLFISDNDVILESVYILRFLSPLYVLYVVGEILSGAIRGTGDTFRPMLVTLAGTCACRILWILFAVPQNRAILMVISSYPVSWAVTSLMFIIYYQFHKAYKYKKMVI